MPQSKYRNVVYTFNNYTDDDIAHLKKIPARYHVMGFECGDQKSTPHIQGFIMLQKQLRHSQVQALLKKNHFEAMRSSAYSADAYCRKGIQSHKEWEELGVDGPNYGKDAKVWSEGEMSTQGKRTDLQRLHEAIFKEKKSYYEICQEHPSILRYANSVRALIHRRDTRVKQPYTDMKVIVIWGPSGYGKTLRAFEIDPNYFTPSIEGQRCWWDGYDPEFHNTILFDDYYGQVPYDTFLRLLHGWSTQLPVKGSTIQKKYSTVVITSNNPPETWYPDGLTPALKRRFTEVIELTEPTEAAKKFAQSEEQ